MAQTSSRLPVSLSPQTRAGILGGAVVVAALAVAVAVDDLRCRPAVQEALTRARMNRADRAAYDQLRAQQKAQNETARAAQAARTAQITGQFDPQMFFPGTPATLDQFDVGQLVEALKFARDQHTAAVRPPLFDHVIANRWRLQVEAVQAEINRRWSSEDRHRLSALESIQLQTYAGTYQGFLLTPPPAPAPAQQQPSTQPPPPTGPPIIDTWWNADNPRPDGPGDEWWKGYGNPELTDTNVDSLTGGALADDGDDGIDSGAEFDDTGNGEDTPATAPGASIFDRPDNGWHGSPDSSDSSFGDPL